LERSVYRDEDTLESLGLNTGAMLYFKDRGLQIGWTTVFLTEYAGPLFVYLWFYRSEGDNCHISHYLTYGTSLFKDTVRPH
jgi:hypothetical protein